MRPTFLKSLSPMARLHSFRAKLLVSITALMVISLLGSVLAFVISTAITRDQLLRQKIAADAERVTQATTARVANVATAADLLANDPQVLAAVFMHDEAALGTLNARAVVVRDRFELDLVQIYDQQGVARTNLLLSNLYRESSMIDFVEPGSSVVREVQDRVLLLSRCEMPGGQGTVITGVDLETELQRLLFRYRLSADLGLSVGCKGQSYDATECARVATHDTLSFDKANGWAKGHYGERLPLTLGETPVELLLVRSTTDIAQVTQTGLTAMIVSILVTTLLLVVLGLVVVRSILQPIQQLSTAAQDIAKGNLDQQIDIAQLAGPLGIGEQDELGLLAVTFNDMVRQLRNLYERLNAKVRARTQELATAADVARAVSSSLDIDVALRASVKLIHHQLEFYYTAIFIVEGDHAVLREAIGEAGQSLQTQGLRLPLGEYSLVGATALTGEPCVIQDVSKDARYLEIPQLPDTAAEAVIPLLVGDRVIGLLDVQSKWRNAFTPEMTKLLLTLADQIAIGVHNAQLYTRQRETAEHLAKANARLQELDEAKNLFIQNVSHELRTPLALIRGYAEALESGMLGVLEEEQRQPVAIIARRTRMMTQLVEDITCLLEVEAQVAPRSPVSLSALTQEVLEDFETLAQRKRLTLRAKILSDLPRVMGQEHNLRKVVDNLVGNALKFTPEGGAIMVQLFGENGHVKLQVSDTGIGIPPDKHAYVFERFYQVDGSIRRRYGGSGLGLALVKEIVQAHGGKVTLESELGQGSTFTVALPAADI